MKRRLHGGGLPLLLVLFLIVPAARAASYDFRSLQLFQPEEVLDQRVGDVGAMSDYVKRLNAAAQGCFGQEKGIPAALDLFIAFRPSGQAKAWVVASEKGAADAPALALALEKVAPPKSRDGLVVLRIHAALRGYAEEPGAPAVLPPEWTAAAQSAGKPLPLDEVVALAWKE